MRPVAGAVRARTLLRELTWPALRAARTVPLFVGAALGIGVAAAPALAGVQLEVHDVVLLLRCAVVLTVLGAAFVLDDPAARTTEVTPVHRAWVALPRCLAAVTVLAAAWTVQVTVAASTLPAGSAAALPTASLTLEPAGLAVCTLALGALGVRTTAEGSGGVLAAPCLLLLVLTALLLPDAATPFAQPHSPAWTPSRHLWTALLAAAALALALLLTERSPRRHRRGAPAR